MKTIDATEQAYKNGYEAGKKSATQTNHNPYWSIAIKNSICMICWTALAIIFNQWWVALFAILFMTFPNTIHKYCRTCDGCGKHSEYADSYNESLDKAKAAGWVHYEDGNKDYCPGCQSEF